MKTWAIIGRRGCACGCGETFDVTSRNPEQKFKGREHLTARWRQERSRRGAEASRLRNHSIARERAERFLTKAEAWKAGHRAGYRLGWERGMRKGKPEITCPLCGVVVKQVASATLSLALWQHVKWVCEKGKGMGNG